MIIVSLLLSIVGVGLLCWLLFALAVYALPFFVGMTVGLAAYANGAGAIGAIAIGLISSTTILVVAHLAFAMIRSPIVRSAVALPFTVSAAIAGYHVTLGLAHIGVASPGWSAIFASFGAIAVGATAFLRMAAIADSPVAGRTM
jgi:hypothetical protein